MLSSAVQSALNTSLVCFWKMYELIHLTLTFGLVYKKRLVISERHLHGKKTNYRSHFYTKIWIFEIHTLNSSLPTSNLALLQRKTCPD